MLTELEFTEAVSEPVFEDPRHSGSCARRHGPAGEIPGAAMPVLF